MTIEDGIKLTIGKYGRRNEVTIKRGNTPDSFLSAEFKLARVCVALGEGLIPWLASQV